MGEYTTEIPYTLGDKVGTGVFGWGEYTTLEVPYTLGEKVGTGLSGGGIYYTSRIFLYLYILHYLRAAYSTICERPKAAIVRICLKADAAGAKHPRLPHSKNPKVAPQG